MTDFPPRIDDLTASYLARRQTDPEGALVSGDVEAYEAVPAQSVDPRQAWDGGLEPLAGLTSTKNLTKLPTGWATLVAGLESLSGLPMAAANFPQAVRDLLPLVKSDDLEKTLTSNAPIADVAGLSGWVTAAVESGDTAKRLIAAGMLRLCRRFDEAQKLLNTTAPIGWENVWANEYAALAWHRGDHAQARDLWAALRASPMTSFNLGMAELFLGHAKAARPHLQAAADQLPESSGWHHLARLYLALAESR